MDKLYILLHIFVYILYNFPMPRFTQNSAYFYVAYLYTFFYTLRLHIFTPFCSFHLNLQRAVSTYPLWNERIRLISQQPVTLLVHFWMTYDVQKAGYAT